MQATAASFVRDKKINETYKWVPFYSFNVHLRNVVLYDSLFRILYFPFENQTTAFNVNIFKANC